MVDKYYLFAVSFYPPSLGKPEVEHVALSRKSLGMFGWDGDEWPIMQDRLANRTIESLRKFFQNGHEKTCKEDGVASDLVLVGFLAEIREEELGELRQGPLQDSSEEWPDWSN